ncbi:MAG TPA: chromate efflux transporter [Thermoanaerobaculia bacterium]|nr:chromate efflux transporter [Thermoanaerobaculia bacterium]
MARRARRPPDPVDNEVSWRTLIGYFFRLGWLAFGGPVGQIGLMHLQVVERRKWISEEEFVRILNFVHVLPGPEALQLAIYLGYKKRGYRGGILAGLLFILPGFITLTALAAIYVRYGATREVLGVLWGFRPVGLALLLAALVRISRAALKNVFQVVLAACAFAAFFFAKISFIPVLLGCGAIYAISRRLVPRARESAALISLPLLPAAALAAGPRLLEISTFFLKVGLFSFGGAYAVLPLLREGAVTTHHWMTDRQMIDALTLGETTPGPLISIGIFIGYLAGAASGAALSGAIAATLWLFLPSFVFVLAAARHIGWLTSQPAIREFLKGVTSGVVGLMFSISIPLAKVSFSPAGRFDPWTVALAIAAFVAVTFWKWRLNVVAVVLAGGVLGLARAFGPAILGL